MKYMSPTDLKIRFTFIGGIPRYASNSSNPSYLHNVVAPHIIDDGPFGPKVVVCFANYLCLVGQFEEVFTTNDPEVIARHMRSYDTLANNVMFSDKALRNMMDYIICDYYKRGEGTVETLANLFQVGEPRIRGALTRAGLLGTGTKHSERAKEKKDALDEVRSDERYRYITKMDRNARTRAKAAAVECSYQREDLFPRINDLRVIPRVCPVLRIPIRYTNSTLPLNAAVIWRKDRAAPMTGDNVAIMSKLASLLIEDPYRSKAQKALSESPMAAQSWREWCVAGRGSDVGVEEALRW